MTLEDSASAVVESLTEEQVKWKDLSGQERAWYIGRNTLRVLYALTLLYWFFVALDLLSTGFKLAAGKQAAELFRSEVLSNPVAGIVIGMLGTVLVQSSGVSTAIIVTLVSEEDGIPIQTAIYMVFGANIGTTVTNTLVSLAQAADPEKFERAFAGSTVHDVYNLLTVFIVTPLEIFTNYIRRLSGEVVSGMNPSGSDFETVGVIIDPVANLLVEADTKQLKNLNITGSLVKGGLLHETGVSDGGAGAITIVIALFLVILTLLLLVNFLKHVLQGRAHRILTRALNMNSYLALLVGCVVTFAFQSSSITTSTLVPLCGLGVITLEALYPLTIGANIGSTGTAMIAAVSSGNPLAVQVAIAHLMFNVSGVLLWFVIPQSRLVPINIARVLGALCAERRWLAIVYLVFFFMALPGAIFGLSFAGNTVFASIFVPLLVIGVGAGIYGYIRVLHPRMLPEWLPQCCQPAHLDTTVEWSGYDGSSASTSTQWSWSSHSSSSGEVNSYDTSSRSSSSGSGSSGSASTWHSSTGGNTTSTTSGGGRFGGHEDSGV
eukprot:TRINITY_DN4306_c0_g2_i1.p1 TRINITY_DN4306_c0_g2~~TRINITY_DN4306_c0_g2_i1.p1  ORF type:complete len:548 (+),score=83.10 TRINITY_DN4306_c0_g2_i1:362-2005(+)